MEGKEPGMDEYAGMNMEAQKLQLEMAMKQLKVNRKVVESSINRLQADVEVIEKVDMSEEKNEIKKKALQAKAEEMSALIENEKLKLEMIDLNMQAAKAQLGSM